MPRHNHDRHERQTRKRTRDARQRAQDYERAVDVQPWPDRYQQPLTHTIQMPRHLRAV